MTSLQAIFVIASKDLAQRGRDRSAYVMGIIGPLALALILGATLGGADDPSPFEIGLAVEDDGPVGDGFRELVTSLEDDGVVVVTVVRDRTELDALVDDGDVAAGFHLADGLSDAVQSGRMPTITVVGDPGSPVGTDVARSIAQTFAAELDYVTVATTSVLTAGAGDDGDVETVTAAALSQPRPIDLVASERDGRGQDLSSYYAVSLSVFFLFFTVQFGVLSLIEEREAGTLDRILMAPISKSAVLIGKMVSSLLLGVLSMVVLVVATTLFGGAEWGDPLAVGVMIVIGVAVATSLAVLVGVLARTSDQAVSFAWAAGLVLGLLGGVFFPVSRADGLLSTVSFLSPHRWLLEGFRDVSYGGGVGDLGLVLAVLGGFVVVVGGIGLASARRGLVRS